MKKLLLVLMLCTFAVACTEEKENNNTTIEQTNSVNYIGTITVGEGNDVFSEDSISIQTSKLVSAKMNIKLLQVKFAQAMPLRLDMEINGIDCVKENDGTYTLTGNNIVPIAMGGEFPTYTITNLNGTIVDSIFDVTMTCGSYPVAYRGVSK
jgi:hypothetical protein